MANIKSAEKQNRQRAKREVRNRARRSAMRTAVKQLRAAVGQGKRDGATAALAGAIRLIDRAAVKGVIKKRTAARHISRLTQAVNGLK